MFSIRTRSHHKSHDSQALRRFAAEQLERRDLLAVLVADGFEHGQWNGQWVEDEQAWSTSTERFAEGSFSATVNGPATDSTLTISNPIDLTDSTNVELSFAWSIDSGGESVDYLALDLYNGNRWQEAALLSGNANQADVWHHESVIVDGDFLGDEFKIRFRAAVSSPSRHGYVDNVQLVTVDPSLPGLSVSNAVAVEGTFSELISDELYRPRGITVGPNGTLYVSSGEDDRVLRFDANTGTFLDEFVSSGRGGLDNPQDLLFGPDGNLYVANGYGDNVLRFDGQTGDFMDQFVSTGSGGLDFPVGITFSPQGNLIVASYLSDEVLLYDGDSGDFIDELVPKGHGNLEFPVYVTFGPDGLLYVTNGAHDSVERYHGITGEHIGQFVPSGSGGLIAPRGLHFNGDGEMYVASARTNEVLRYNASDGSFLGVLIPRSEGLIFPIDLISSEDGSVYVTSRDGSDLLRQQHLRSAEFTVGLSHASTSLVTVEYRTTDGSSHAGSDFHESNGTVTIPPGTTKQPIVVPLINDSVDESDEYFQIILSNPIGAKLNEPFGIATTIDDDAPPELDPQYRDQWNLNSTGQFGGTPDADINAPEAWEITKGNRSTVVAVIDSGVDYTHNDLYLNIWLNEREIPASVASNLVDTDGDGIFTFHDLNNPSNSSFVTDHNSTGYIDGGDLLADALWTDGIDSDGNGYIDDIIGWDTRDDDNDPMDQDNHGTHIAGILAAIHDNQVGIKGVSPNIRLMSLRFKLNNPTWNPDDAVEAIDYAVGMGAPISSNSWGNGSGEFIQEIYDAIDRARLAGHLFVAASGNEARNTDTRPRYPAAYDLDNIISVASTDLDDRFSSFSNRGKISVDLAAPGEMTYSTRQGDTYGYGSGTSYATPHVAGVAALIHGLQPSWSWAQIKSHLFSTVDPLPSLTSRMVTGGRLNAASAVSTALNTIPGDSNRDGVFNSSDLVHVFRAGKYEDNRLNNATFDEGDWNGDGDFNSADFVFVFTAGTYQANATPRFGGFLPDSLFDTSDGDRDLIVKPQSPDDRLIDTLFEDELAFPIQLANSNMRM